MDKKLDEMLCEKYPQIFKNRNADVRYSPMGFGFEHGNGWYNIIDSLCAVITNHLKNNKQHIKTVAEDKRRREMAANDDWSFLYERGSAWNDWLKDPKNLETEKGRYLGPAPDWMQNLEEIPEVIAEQVKEKYGTLRFYISGGDDYIYGAVAMAEAMSGRICERCGAPGKIRTGGWISTLCDSHAKEKGYDPINVEKDKDENWT